MTSELIRPESEEKIANMFDEIAPRYDLLNALLSARQDRRWRKKLISFVKVQKPGEGRFLDVATGTGDVLLELWKTKGSEFRLLQGVDISSEMLSLAKMKALKAAAPLGFQKMSAEELYFPAQEFDAVSISFGLRNVVNKGKALGEFHRVLKPGGRLLILEFFEPDQSILSKVFQFYLHQILPRIGGLLSSRSAYTYLPKSIASFYTEPELCSKLTQLGFETERVVSYLFGSCRLVVAIKR